MIAAFGKRALFERHYRVDGYSRQIRDRHSRPFFQFINPPAM